MPITKLPRPPEHLRHYVNAGQVRLSVHGRFQVVKSKTNYIGGDTWRVRDDCRDGSNVTLFEMSEKYLEENSWLVGYVPPGPESMIIYSRDGGFSGVSKLSAAEFSESEVNSGPSNYLLKEIQQIYGQADKWINPLRKYPTAPETRAAIIPPGYYPETRQDDSNDPDGIQRAPSPLVTCESCKGTGGDERGTCRGCRGTGSVKRADAYRYDPVYDSRQRPLKGNHVSVNGIPLTGEVDVKFRRELLGNWDTKIETLPEQASHGMMEMPDGSKSPITFFLGVDPGSESHTTVTMFDGKKLSVLIDDKEIWSGPNEVTIETEEPIYLGSNSWESDWITEDELDYENILNAFRIPSEKLYRVVGTETGRMSCKAPNLHNFLRREDGSVDYGTPLDDATKTEKLSGETAAAEREFCDSIIQRMLDRTRPPT